jgi:hypothetical protein
VKRPVLLLICLLLSQNLVFSWGFWAHKRINQEAIATLPKKLRAFYDGHRDFIIEHATTPDRRRYVDSAEACRHYIDLDWYEAYPFDSLPRKWDAAVVKYSEDSMKEHGILPWQIASTYYRLVSAFQRRDENAILRLSAGLGHYVGDAHVPLHTTENYDGQETDQEGIHALWETRLPELFGEGYTFRTKRATYIADPLTAAWHTVFESHSLLDSVLALEKQVQAQFPEEQRYVMEKRGTRKVKTYSPEYAAAYHKLLNGMVEQRMQKAIYITGCLWLSAWIDAGRPDLRDMPAAMPDSTNVTGPGGE